MLARTVLAFAFLILAVISDESISRIINGTRALQGSYPQLVSIQDNIDGMHFCGGTIVNRNFVLTAAHCMVNKKYLLHDISIVSSTVNLKKKGRTYRAIEIIVHKKFKKSLKYANDIALIKVQPSFRLKGGEAMTKLPAKLAPVIPLGSTGTVVGWGRVSQFTLTDHLNQVDQEIIGNEECEELLDMTLFDSMVCGVRRNTNNGFCKGDSGGPLFVDGVQVGVVSWYMHDCGDGPNVYTKVSHFIDWINGIIEG